MFIYQDEKNIDAVQLSIPHILWGLVAESYICLSERGKSKGAVASFLRGRAQAREWEEAWNITFTPLTSKCQTSAVSPGNAFRKKLM